MKKRTKIIIGILSVVGVAIMGFVIWALDSYGPMEEALNALESDENVSISQKNDAIIFSPPSGEVNTGLIFYPGGKVEPEAYSVLARSIAESGFFVAIVKFPLNLGFFNPGLGLKLKDQVPIQNWYIGGHSLGGSMAAKAVHDNPDAFQGLILLAAYAADNNDISEYDIDCLVMYGDQDGVLSKNVTNTLDLLPEDADVVEIEGGNHANFGYYGKQSGDKEATISREEQHQITLSNITHFMGS